jgi:hypothetical protein
MDRGEGYINFTGGVMKTAEDEEFERIERESRSKNQEAFKATPSREQLMAEVAVLTELVRVLSGRVAELEKNT